MASVMTLNQTQSQMVTIKLQQMNLVRKKTQSPKGRQHHPGEGKILLRKILLRDQKLVTENTEPEAMKDHKKVKHHDILAWGGRGGATSPN
jgi:hypothetical protein